MDSVVKDISFLFNGPMETGVRSLTLLDEAHPIGFDLGTLVWLDHLVVHTEDIGGPQSLHPKLPHRNGELLIRRQIIESGLTLMRQIHLITAIESNTGILYYATEDAKPALDLMTSEYNTTLKANAKWLIKFFDQNSSDHIRDIINSKIGIWNIEFQEATRGS